MFRVRDFSITKKLTWMNMLVSGAALLLACAAFVTYELVAFRETMVRSLSIQAQIVGSNSVSALLFNDPQSAENTLAALKAAPNIVSAWIYTADGRRFAGYWRDRGGQSLPLPAIPAGQTEVHWFKDRQIVLVRSIVFQGKPTGAVYIRSDLQEMNDRLKRYAGIVAVVLSASLIAAFLISAISQRAIAEPIVHLAETARIVSREKNYSVRAATTGTRDEVAVLIEAFNEMLARIQELNENLERRVVERTAELNAANKELEAFSYSVSHDLRAPLRAIDGFSQALLEDYAGKLDDAGKDYLNRVRAATQMMCSLIDDLLNLSRLTRTVMQLQSVDISVLVHSIVSDLQKAQPERQVQVRIQDGLKTSADPGLVRVALENLLSNAWKFTSKRACAHIEFGQADVNGTLAFFVRDDGAGFDPAYVDRLFGAFQRLHAETEFAGTGIGLATVQRIVRRHGGRVWAEGEVDHGATFYFTLADKEYVDEHRGNSARGGQSGRRGVDAAGAP